MRLAMMILAVAVCCVALGCASVDEFLNPSATTEGGSRVTSKLRALPKPDPALKKTITVYRFQNKTSFLAGLHITNGMTDQLITGLVKSGHFKVVERNTLGDLMTEKALQKSGEATGSAAGKKITGADLIVTGAVTELDQTSMGGVNVGGWHGRVGVDLHSATVALDLRIIDAGTSEIVDSIDVRKKLRKAGISGGYHWSHAKIKVSNALDLAIRECLEEAVYEMVIRHGATALTKTAAPATTTTP